MNPDLRKFKINGDKQSQQSQRLRLMNDCPEIFNSNRQNREDQENQDYENKRNFLALLKQNLDHLSLLSTSNKVNAKKMLNGEPFNMRDTQTRRLANAIDFYLKYQK